MLPAGPGGAAEYISLPADSRILSGQCSYAVLQQADGSRKIVMMENSSADNAGTYGDSSWMDMGVVVWA